MIKFEKTEVVGWEAAIRGMRNPMNSWEKSDSYLGYDCKTCGRIELEGNCKPKEHDCSEYLGYEIGPNDLDLMKRLRNAGTDHRKFMRMIMVYADVTAPLYWWKEADTYRIGIEKNSCSTMHKIAAKEFELDDFSTEHLFTDNMINFTYQKNDFRVINNKQWLMYTIDILNSMREAYLDEKDPDKKKDIWWQMIQLLPSSYNQKRTVMLSYEVLANIYKSRKNHKLDEWREHETPLEHHERNKDFTCGVWGFCDWIETLPYSELITGDYIQEEDLHE